VPNVEHRASSLPNLLAAPPVLPQYRERLPAVRPDTTAAARWTVVLSVLTGLAVAAWIYTASSPSAAGGSGYTQSVAGPVGPDDRAMLVDVHQALLWELPAVEQAGQVATDPKVRRMSSDMSERLSLLSDQVQAVAQRLDVQLPNQPSSQQQMWSTDVSGSRGGEYDREMVGYLYQSCRSTMAAVTRARASTANADIRSLAQMTAHVLGDHVRYLDGTGLVAPPI
jgi:predicted outer membrane protein